MDLSDYEFCLSIGDYASITKVPIEVCGNLYLAKLTLSEWENIPQPKAFFYNLTHEIQNDMGVLTVALSKLRPCDVLPYVSNRVLHANIKDLFAVAYTKDPEQAFTDFGCYVENFQDILTPNWEQVVFMHTRRFSTNEDWALVHVGG